MRAIEDEAARMGQLVEDLLLLARLDEERPLATRPIALDRVVELAVSAAKVVDPERPLDCQLEQPIVVAGDETRLRQVVNNLLANTRRHTPASALGCCAAHRFYSFLVVLSEVAGRESRFAPWAMRPSKTLGPEEGLTF